MSRIRILTDRAENAFWRALAEALPSVKTGDMDPGAAAAFRAAAERAVEHWLACNEPAQPPPPCGHQDCTDWWTRERAGGGQPWCLHCPVCGGWQCDCGFSPEELEAVLRERWGDAVILEHTGGGCMNPTIYLRGDSRSDSAAYVMFTIGWYPEECGFGLYSLTGEGEGWEEPVRQWTPSSPEDIPLDATHLRELVYNTVRDWLAPLA